MSIRLSREARPPAPPHPEPEPARDAHASRGSREAPDARAADAQAADAHEPSAFAKLLGGIGHEVTKGESQVRSALDAAKAGRDLGPAELLALQAGVYRYSETVDLASKLVDRATNGMKTVVQGQ